MKKIAIDIGGTNIEYEIYTDNKLTYKNKFKVNGMNKDELLKKLSNIINEHAGDFPEVKIGISSPTALNTDTGYCAGMSGIKEYGNFNLYDELYLLLKNKNIKLMAMNDGNAALLGVLESKFETKPKSAIMVALGTGMGGAIYLDGKIFPGSNNWAGEFGVPMWKGKDNISVCLSPVNFFTRVINNGMDGKEIFDNYSIDLDITKKIDRWLYDMAKFISYISYFLNPEVIVFNGGVTSNETFQKILLKQVKKYYIDFEIDNDIKTEIRFFKRNPEENYALIGAKVLID